MEILSRDLTGSELTFKISLWLLCRELTCWCGVGGCYRARVNKENS